MDSAPHDILNRTGARIAVSTLAAGLLRQSQQPIQSRQLAIAADPCDHTIAHMMTAGRHSEAWELLSHKSRELGTYESSSGKALHGIGQRIGGRKPALVHKADRTHEEPATDLREDFSFSHRSNDTPLDIQSLRMMRRSVGTAMSSRIDRSTRQPISQIVLSLLQRLFVHS